MHVSYVPLMCDAMNVHVSYVPLMCDATNVHVSYVPLICDATNVHVSYVPLMCDAMNVTRNIDMWAPSYTQPIKSGPFDYKCTSYSQLQPVTASTTW